MHHFIFYVALLLSLFTKPVSASSITISPGQSIQNSINSAKSGDTIIVLPGTYNERVSLSSQHNNLTIQAEGDVKMQGFKINDSNGITIRGFTITTLTDTIPDGTGVYITKATNCHIDNNEILYNTWGGIFLGGDYSNPRATKNCKITNNVFRRNAMYGMQIMGQDHLIEGNDISHTIQHHPCTKSTASWLDADGLRFHGSGHVIRGNYIHDLPMGPDGYTTGKACNIANISNLSYDFVTNSHTDAMQTYGNKNEEIGAHNILIENNRIILPPANEWSGGMGAKAFQASGYAGNITIRNNLVVADLLGLFETEVFNLGKLHDIAIYHNTFIGSNHPISQGFSFADVEGNNSIKNNIFYQQYNGVTHLMTKNSSVAQDYNCIWRRNGWHSPGSHDINLDPLFANLSNNDYRLSINSPCKDSGTNLSLSSDLLGTSRTQDSKPDIGAYEYTSNPNPTILTPGPGDLNKDRYVNLLDYNELIINFGDPYTIIEFNAIVANYGKNL